jgi:TonB family protein
MLPTRPNSCRSCLILAVIISSPLFCHVRLKAATDVAKKSDADISQQLVGDWESNFENKRVTLIKQVFSSFDSRKNFKVIRIMEVPGIRGRVEYEGKWRITNGELICQPSKVSGLGWSEPFKARLQKMRILSVENDIVALREEDGIGVELRRTPIPSQLPPLLARGALARAVTLLAPKPEYPEEARHEHLQGAGLFRLIIDEKSGTVSSVHVKQSTGHRILDEAAIRTLKDWRVRPRTVEYLVVPVNFKLTKPWLLF